jgi:chromosome segregation ATPase
MSDTNGHGTPAHEGVGENLEKVRDILFGTQMRQQETRFAKMEERLARELTEAREDTRKRLETLEGYIKREIQTVLDRVKQEQGHRADAVSAVDGRVKDLQRIVEERASTVEDRAGEAQLAMRQELLEQAKAMRDEIAATQKDIMGMVEQALTELQGRKTDRAALAELFGQLATRLRDDSLAGDRLPAWR